MPGIFISYRRENTAGYVGRLCDALKKHVGSTPIFLDIDSMEPGVDFVDRIGSAVGSSDVLLAVIGPAWLTASKGDGQRRLHDPQDYVRKEIQEALSRNIRVIPVLVGGASMPGVQELPPELSALARRQAYELSDTRWDYDVERLSSHLVKRRTHGRLYAALLGLAIPAPLMVFQVVLAEFSLEPLERTVAKIGYLSLPLLGLTVGAAFGDLGTRLRGAVAGATIGGLNNLLSWPLGWWLWSGANLGTEPIEVFKSVIVYLPGGVIAYGLSGIAIVSADKALYSRRAMK